MRKPAGFIALAGLTVFLVLGISPVSGESLSEVAERIGAETFYNLGYTGTLALLGNIEAGMTWDAHEALDDGRVIQQENPFSLAGDNTENHATLVGGTMVCEETPSGGPGIAYGSTLWTSDIATYFGTGGSFGISGNSLLYPLMVYGEVGINASGEVGEPDGKTVDVINSSWGAADDSGNTIINCIYDYLANSAGVTMVVAAGNAGQGDGKVGTPANGWNVIAVGATGGGENEEVTSWSSGGPSGSFNLPGTRTKPDIVAPGLSISMPAYNTGNPSAFQLASGTSFASPVTAASTGLLIDFGKDTGRSTDPRLIKSVLLNSAVKLSGWSQETDTHPSAGTVINYTPVDSAQGTGRVDLSGAHKLYLASNAEGSGSGAVGKIGWDLSTVSEGAPEDYFINTMLPAGSTLTATLIWFMDRSVSGFDHNSSNPYAGTSFSNDSFDDLDLYLYEADGGGSPIGSAVAASISGWDPANPDGAATGLDSVEHLYLQLPADGRYLLRVDWAQELFDYISDVNEENFALSWSVDVPTPGDANGNGLIDGEDLAIWQANYDPLGSGENTFGMGDWNFDGLVDGSDLALWQQNYDPVGSASANPEPATLMLVALGAMMLRGPVRVRARSRRLNN